MQKRLDYDWKQIYKDFLKSKMSVYEYAVTHDIPKTTMFYGIQRMKKADRQKIIDSSEIDTSSFVEVCIEEPKQELVKDQSLGNNSPITLNYKDVIIEIDNGINKTLLKDILRMIKEVC